MNPKIAGQIPLAAPSPPDVWAIPSEVWEKHALTAYNDILGPLSNLNFAAMDMVKLQRAANDANSQNPWLKPAYHHLLYYYQGLKSIYSVRPEELQQEPTDPNPSASIQELRQLQAPGNTVLPPLGDEIPGELPNLDLVELVVQATYFGQEQKPTTLVQLRDMLQTTTLFRRYSGAVNGKHWQNALPDVVTMCLGHGEELQVGCSVAKWLRLKELFKQVAVWRRLRFQDRGRRDAIEAGGRDVHGCFAKFKSDDPDDTKSMLTVAKEAEAGNAQDLRASLTKYNTIIEAIWKDPDLFVGGNVAKGRKNYAFDHTTELACSFVGWGREVFTPISRCWKCRFLHLYNVTEDGFGPENPATTSFNANAPLSCGEDLCHYYCSSLKPETASLIAPTDECKKWSLVAVPVHN